MLGGVCEGGEVGRVGNDVVVGGDGIGLGGIERAAVFGECGTHNALAFGLRPINRHVDAAKGENAARVIAPLVLVLRLLLGVTGRHISLLKLVAVVAIVADL